MPRPRTRQEFEALVTKINFVENSTFSGFADVKMIECVTEAYFQILLLLVMYSRDSYDGIVNFEIFGSESEWSRRLFFYINGFWSFLTMVMGLVGFVFQGENKSFGLKQRGLLIIIYLIQGITSLYNLVAVMGIRLTVHSYITARIILASFYGARILILITYSAFSYSSQTRPLTRKIYFCVANLNMPVHFGSFENRPDKASEMAGYSEFVFVWTLNVIDSMMKAFCVLIFQSDEVLSNTLLSFRKLDLILITLSADAMIFTLISIYFRKVYLWKDVLFRSHEKNEGLKRVSDLTNRPLNTYTGKPVNPDNDHEDRVKVLEVLKVLKAGKEENEEFTKQLGHEEQTNTPVEQSKSTYHKRDVLNVLISFMCVFATSTLCYVGVDYKQAIQTRPRYADCSEVYLAKKENGIYETQSEKGPPRFTYCHSGLTLVQKLDPESGNHPFYFERSLKSYQDGFGITSREYWIGLQYMVYLNEKRNNTFLRVEGTFHNGTKFWVEYRNFSIKESGFDDTKYQLLPDEQVQINRKENYTITSMIMYKSSSSTHQFVIIRPNYLKEERDKFRDRQIGNNALKKVHDRYYSGFTVQVSNYAT
jgi:hypothetical protein